MFRGFPIRDLVQAFVFWLNMMQLLVGGLEHELYFSIYWERHHPN